MPRSYCERMGYHRRYHAENKERINAYAREWRARNKEHLRTQREERRQKIYDLKSQPCVDCRGTFPPEAMDFHHRDPATKEFTVGNQIMLGWQRMLDEIAKCDLLCANCHRIRTFAKKQEASV